MGDLVVAFRVLVVCSALRLTPDPTSTPTVPEKGLVRIDRQMGAWGTDWMGSCSRWRKGGGGRGGKVAPRRESYELRRQEDGGSAAAGNPRERKPSTTCPALWHFFSAKSSFLPLVREGIESTTCSPTRLASARIAPSHRLYLASSSNACFSSPQAYGRLVLGHMTSAGSRSWQAARGCAGGEHRRAQLDPAADRGAAPCAESAPSRDRSWVAATAAASWAGGADPLPQKDRRLSSRDARPVRYRQRLVSSGGGSADTVVKISVVLTHVEWRASAST